MKKSELGSAWPVASPASQWTQDMQLVTAFADASVGMVEADLSTGCFVRVNNAFCDISGHAHDDLVGASFLLPIHPEDRQKHVDCLARLLAGENHVYRTETRFLRRDGGIRWVDLSINVIRSATEGPLHILAVVQDVTERRLAEDALQQSKDREAFLLRLSDALRPLANPSEIQSTAARLLGEHLGANRVVYADVEGSDCITCTSYLHDASALAERMPIAAFGEALMENYRRGEAIAVNDVAAEPRLTDDERSFLLKLQVAAFIRLVLVKGYQWVGTFGVHSISPRNWTRHETDLVREVAERIWASVERARAEARLRDSQELSRSTLQALPAHIVVIDRTGCILTVNQAWENFAAENAAGDKRSVSASVNYLEVCRKSMSASEDAARALNGIEAVLSGKESIFTMEYPCHSPQASRWFLMTVVPLKANGQGGAVISHLDITDRRNAAKQLAESEERLRLAMDAGNVFTWEIDLDSRGIIYSDNQAKVFGFDIPATEDGVISLIHPDDIASVRCAYMKAMASRAPFAVEHRFISRRTGEISWCKAEGRFMGEGRKRFVGVARNITAEKEAEQRLRESEERFSLASEAASFGVHDFDVRRRRMNWSPGLWRLVGLAGEGRISLRQVFASIHPEDRDRVRSEMRGIVRRTGPYETEYCMLRPDGSFFWVFDRGEAFGPLSGTTGKAKRVTGTIIDITERKEAEDQVRLLMREVNHRSKNLLAVVLAVANQMARQHEPEEFVELFSQRLKGLAASQDLLVESNWKGVDLANLVAAQLSHFRDLIGTRIMLDGPPLRLTAAAAQSIGMALHELATNAGKYGSLSNHAGEVKVAWEIASGKEGPVFRMGWKERGGPPVSAPAHKGFGHMVMVHMAERSLMGEVYFSHNPEGVVWKIEAPVRFALEQKGQ